MTSILRLRMYAQEMRALRSRKNRQGGKSNVNSLLIPHKPLHMRKDRALARAFIVVTHNCIQGSKAVILLCEDMVDDHEVYGAFHQLRVAKAFKQLANS